MNLKIEKKGEGERKDHICYEYAALALLNITKKIKVWKKRTIEELLLLKDVNNRAKKSIAPR